ncbi:MAG: SulP family inorganic anion transporter [Halioglobus sp.]|nr:SulP family inorganic anion transporter [Halioglobus sp.]
MILAPTWLAKYERDWFAPDVAAGLTAAAVVIPKALAYATIAGLPVQVGLYTAFIPPLVYALLGTSRNLSVTTTTTIAILAAAAIGEAVSSGSGVSLVTATATLSVLVGLMLLAARVLRLGFLASFISDPVLTGFKAGIGCVIVLDQLPKVLGVHIEKTGFFRDILAILEQFSHVSLPTVLVAGASFAVLLLLRRLWPRLPAPVIAVGGAIAAAYLLALEGTGVSLVGAIPAGMPSLSMPDRDLLLLMWPAAVGIALMSFTESIAAARAFRREGEARVVSNQELVATGVGNLVSGFFGAMPSGGGTSQTAVNASAGARSQLSGVVVALIALATMLFLAPLLGKMPHATLAAVVIVYSVGLISPAEMQAILRVRAIEFRWALVAFLGVVLLGTLKGILVAVLVSMLSLMYQSNNPMVYALRRKPGTNIFRPRSPEHPGDEELPGILIARIVGRVYFANAQNVGEKVRELLDEAKPKVLVLDCSAIQDFEYTALKGLSEFEAELRGRGIRLIFAALNPSALEGIRRTTLAETLATDGIFPTVESAVVRYAEHPAV